MGVIRAARSTGWSVVVAGVLFAVAVGASVAVLVVQVATAARP